MLKSAVTAIAQPSVAKYVFNMYFIYIENAAALAVQWYAIHCFEC